jgi:hypothetical protein
MALASVGVVLLVKSGCLLARHLRLHRGEPWLILLLWPLYELLLAPTLLAVALFRRHVVWRGRRYSLGPGA